MNLNNVKNYRKELKSMLNTIADEYYDLKNTEKARKKEVIMSLASKILK